MKKYVFLADTENTSMLLTNMLKIRKLMLLKFNLFCGITATEEKISKFQLSLFTSFLTKSNQTVVNILVLRVNSY